ncbi:hypothetical protein Tco_1104853 [Tanacetum coccineum]
MMVILQPRNSSKLRQNVLHLQSSPTIIFSLLAILSPINGVLAGINWLLIFRRSRLKQCSYRIFEADPPSTYMRCIQWPPFSASIIIRPSIPSSSPRGGKEISRLGENLYLFDQWKRFLPFVIRSCHLSPEERCSHSHHFVNCFWDFVMETLDEFRVCDSMHESGDSYAL